VGAALAVARQTQFVGLQSWVLKIGTSILHFFNGLADRRTSVPLTNDSMIYE